MTGGVESKMENTTFSIKLKRIHQWATLVKAMKELLSWLRKIRGTGSFIRIEVLKFRLRAVKMHKIKFSTCAFFSPLQDILCGSITIDFSFKIRWVRGIWKSDSKFPVCKQIWIFWRMVASYRKMQESRPPLKFNFTARTTSPYPHVPFLKLSNGIGFF